MDVYKCAQEITSCLPSDDTLPAVLPSLVLSLLEIQIQLAVRCIGGREPKTGCNTQ